MGNIAPCKNCKERREKCHGSCPKYRVWKAEHEADRKDIRERFNSVRSQKTIRIAEKRALRKTAYQKKL